MELLYENKHAYQFSLQCRMCFSKVAGSISEGLTEQRAVTYTIMSQNGSWQTFSG